MARIVKPLTVTTLKNSKAKDKEYTLSDGKGLQIKIFPNGSKLWRFSYRFNQKLQRISLGAFPDISLETARRIASEYRGLVQQGIDPRVYREASKQEQLNKQITLQEMAEKWHKRRLEKALVKEKTAIKSFRRLEIHLLPLLGHLSIQDITLKKVVQALEPIDATDNLYKMNISLIQIFDLAESEEIIERNPLKLLHNHFNYRECKNQPTIEPHYLSGLFRALDRSNISKPTSLLIEWQLLTMLRPAEAVSVEWSDVDFDKSKLHIPAERMKGGQRSHDVALSKQALAILDKMRGYNGNRKHIFASFKAPYDRPMSSQTANNAIKKIGYKGVLVAHGLRSIASTYLHDLDRFSEEAIELCLSHDKKSKVRSAYDKSKKWKSRQIVMQVWGDYVENAKLDAVKAV
ncbi:integrase [Pasteurellaceae bacterium 15-036681]|nr:integrase [Pasteurellaceae bacterium 15-036681]